MAVHLIGVLVPRPARHRQKEAEAVLQHALSIVRSSLSESIKLVLERSPTITGCRSRLFADTREGDAGAQAHRWRGRGPLKPGDMQVGTPEWMKNRPEYQRVID